MAISQIIFQLLLALFSAKFTKTQQFLPESPSLFTNFAPTFTASSSSPLLQLQLKQQPYRGQEGSGGLGTHVLDIASGQPAPGVNCTAFWWDEMRQGWVLVGMSNTNEHGRIHSIVALELTPLNLGVYKIRFETRPYFIALGRPSFFPFIEVAFTVDDPNRKYHVPLTLSNFGYSTYRGQ